MSFRLFLSLAAVCSIASAQVLQVNKNLDNIVVAFGEQADLVCNAGPDVIPKYCSFLTPDNTNWNLGKGAKYENGRIENFANSESDCGVRIKNVEDKDNGNWKCTITNDKFETGEGIVTVTVAMAPKRLLLRVDGVEAVGETVEATLNEIDGAEMNIDCVATQARPKPEFKWFVGTTEIQGDVSNTEENASNDGKADFVQTLKYYANARHNRQALRCEVTHQAYTKAALAQNENKIEKILELFFKPQQKKEQVFYNLIEGQKNDITIKFESNPMPTSGLWHLAGVETPVAVGTESNNGKFKSSHFEQGEVAGEYSVTLNINQLVKEMAEKPNKLKVTNTHGTTEYVFKLALGDKPAADGTTVTINESGNAQPVTTGPVVGVIVIVLIVLLIVGIAVLARSKGMFCFSAKNGEPLTEEKEAAAFDAAEKGEPLNPKEEAKPTPDKRPETEPVKADAPEDKKSNGAHTPV